jgi:hypothetical protein
MTWPAFLIPLDLCCGSDLNCPLKISFFDAVDKAKPTHIGCFTATVSQLLNAGDGAYLLHSNEVTGRMVGEVEISRFSMYSRSTSLREACGGVKLSFVTAIDFGTANDHSNWIGSLHWLSAHQSTVYEKCMRALGSTLFPHSTEQYFPVFGYGCRMPGGANAVFPLSLDDSRPGLSGIEEMLTAYREAVQRSAGRYDAYYGIPELLIERVLPIVDRNWRESGAFTVVLLLAADGCLFPGLHSRLIEIAAGAPMCLQFISFRSPPSHRGSGFGINQRYIRSYLAQARLPQPQLLLPPLEFPDFANDPDRMAELVSQEIAKKVSDFRALCNLPPRMPQ